MEGNPNFPESIKLCDPSYCGAPNCKVLGSGFRVQGSGFRV